MDIVAVLESFELAPQFYPRHLLEAHRCPVDHGFCQIEDVWVVLWLNDHSMLVTHEVVQILLQAAKVLFQNYLARLPHRILIFQ